MSVLKARPKHNVQNILERRGEKTTHLNNYCVTKLIIG